MRKWSNLEGRRLPAAEKSARVGKLPPIRHSCHLRHAAVERKICRRRSVPPGEQAVARADEAHQGELGNVGTQVSIEAAPGVPDFVQDGGYPLGAGGGTRGGARDAGGEGIWVRGGQPENRRNRGAEEVSRH